MIAKIIFFIFFIFQIFACTNIRNSNRIYESKFQINHIINNKVFLVKDSTQYSSLFLNDLRELSPDYDTLVLIDNKLIVNSKPYNGREYVCRVDTTLIPSGIPSDKVVTYKAELENQLFVLTLKKINFTNIEYEFKIDEKIVKHGQAILPGGFILGLETDKDEEGLTYGVIQYFDKSECWISIKIDFETGEKARFNILCENDTIKNIKIIPMLKKE